MGTIGWPVGPYGLGARSVRIELGRMSSPQILGAFCLVTERWRSRTGADNNQSSAPKMIHNRLSSRASRSLPCAQKPSSRRRSLLTLSDHN